MYSSKFNFFSIEIFAASSQQTKTYVFELRVLCQELDIMHQINFNLFQYSTLQYKVTYKEKSAFNLP